MNKQSKNFIQASINRVSSVKHTDNNYYNAILASVYNAGYYIGCKLQDEYTDNMQGKINKYSILDGDNKELNSMLVINECFNNEYIELNAYIS